MNVNRAGWSWPFLDYITNIFLEWITDIFLEYITDNLIRRRALS